MSWKFKPITFCKFTTEIVQGETIENEGLRGEEEEEKILNNYFTDLISDMLFWNDFIF